LAHRCDEHQVEEELEPCGVPFLVRVAGGAQSWRLEPKRTSRSQVTHGLARSAGIAPARRACTCGQCRALMSAPRRGLTFRSRLARGPCRVADGPASRPEVIGDRPRGLLTPWPREAPRRERTE